MYLVCLHYFDILFENLLWATLDLCVEIRPIILIKYWNRDCITSIYCLDLEMDLLRKMCVHFQSTPYWLYYKITSWTSRIRDIRLLQSMCADDDTAKCISQQTLSVKAGMSSGRVTCWLGLLLPPETTWTERDQKIPDTLRPVQTFRCWESWFVGSNVSKKKCESPKKLPRRPVRACRGSRSVAG